MSTPASLKQSPARRRVGVTISDKHYHSLVWGVLFIIGLALVGQGSYMQAKAWLAQQLIHNSWQQNLAEHNAQNRPWPWADIQAVAQLRVPAYGVVQYLMQDSSGEALAFGGGILPGSVLPASAGHSIIAGHRDSHFAFLKHLVNGDIIETQNIHGEQRRYRVNRMRVVDTRTSPQIYLQPNVDRLTLITCYPFNATIPGGPLRYVVDAEALSTTP